MKLGMTLDQKNGILTKNLRLLVKVLAVAALSACSAIPSFNTDNYVEPVNGASVMPNTTTYTKELDCLGDYIDTNKLMPVRIAVGHIDDFTGKMDVTNGRRITQGAALMAISAVARTHLPIVERLDVSTSEMEFKYTDNKLIGDNKILPDHSVQKEPGFRKTFAGSVLGSDYHIIGGITEVNYNIRSGSLDSTLKYWGVSGRYAVLNVAVDLRLVNTRTLEVVDVVSFQKQIIGTEIRTGVFSFFSDQSSVLDINAAEKTQEPVQRAVRMVVEHGVFELISKLYKVPETNMCIVNPNKPEQKSVAGDKAVSPAAAKDNDSTALTPPSQDPVMHVSVDAHTFKKS